jgi:hypothetical protein
MSLRRDLVVANVAHDWFTLSDESLITRARIICAASFLETDFKHLMFVDADIRFTSEQVWKLVEMQKPIAVGCYKMKKTGAALAAWRGGKLVRLEDCPKVPFDVEYAGTGFMLIERRVFIEMAAHYPELMHEQAEVGQCCAFFHEMLYGGTLLPEDYSFCQRWRDMGGEVWMHPDVKLVHYGRQAFA